MITNLRKHLSERELMQMLEIAAAQIDELNHRRDIAENRTKHLEIELAQAKTSIDTWRRKFHMLTGWVKGSIPVLTYYNECRKEKHYSYLPPIL